MRKSVQTSCPVVPNGSSRSSLTPRLLSAAIAWSALLAGSAPALAGDHVDSRLDFYEYAGDRFLTRFSNAVAFHTFSNRLTDEGNGTFSFNVEPWLEDLFPANCPGVSTMLCPGVRFRGQPIADPWNGSSAFLVGDDLVLVARHTFGGGNGDPTAICANGRAFVFDHYQYAIRRFPPFGDRIFFPEENVYFCKEAVAWGVNAAGTNDWVVVRLDRPVPNRRVPFQIRREGAADVGTPVSVIGFPDRLPLKLERSAVESASEGGFVRVPAFVRPGNSGGPVINELSGRVEGMIRSGPTGYDCDEVGDCRIDPPFTATGTAISFVSAMDAIPPIGMQVSPDTPVEHHGPPGGPFTNGEPALVMGFTYEIAVPAPEPGFLPSRTVRYTITPDDGGVIGLRRPGRGVLQPEPIEGELAPGDVQGIVTGLLPTANALPAGLHEPQVTFFDGAYRATDLRTHRIFVGVEGFDVLPDEPFAGDGPGVVPGVNTRHKTYVMVNKYLVEQRVQVSASDPWILIDGGPGPETFTLDPITNLPLQGTQQQLVPGGPSAQTRISLDGTDLPDGVHVGQVEFVSLFDSGPSPEPIVREVRLDIGRRFFPSAAVPVVVNSEQPVLIPVDLPEALFEVLDVDAEVELEYLGGAFRGLRLGLVSPTGTEITLFEDRIGDPGDTIDTIWDDDTNPPYRQSRLEVFNGELAAGTWNLIVAPRGDEGRIEVREFVLRMHLAPPGANE